MSREQRETQKLNTLAVGKKGTVIVLQGGRRFQERLVSMGINIGCEIEVLHGSQGQNGPVLIRSGETRLAVGQGMAERILVGVDNRGTRPKWLGLREACRGWSRSCC